MNRNISAGVKFSEVSNMFNVHAICSQVSHSKRILRFCGRTSNEDYVQNVFSLTLGRKRNGASNRYFCERYVATAAKLVFASLQCNLAAI